MSAKGITSANPAVLASVSAVPTLAEPAALTLTATFEYDVDHHFND